MTDLKTRSATLAGEYLALGGKRLAKMDDNLISTRKWDGEPEEASAFWDEKIANLPSEQLTEVESHLPSYADR